MTDRLRKNLSNLRKIFKSKPEKRNQYLKEADSELVKCLCECAINVLNSNVPINQRQTTVLGKHKNLLRLLANRKVSLKSKKSKILRQGGAFILALLRPVLAAIAVNLIA